MAAEDPIDRAVRVLNEAVAADPACIDRLMRVEAGCNDSLADHPSIQVSPSFLTEGPTAERPLVLRPIGLINGLLGVRDNGYGYIAMICADDTVLAPNGTVIGFLKIADPAADPDIAAQDQPQDGDTFEGEALVVACAAHNECGLPATHRASVVVGGISMDVALCDNCGQEMIDG